MKNFYRAFVNCCFGLTTILILSLSLETLAFQPIASPPPAITMTVEGITVESNNDAVNDSGVAIVFCGSSGILDFSNIMNADGSATTPNEKVTQYFILNNVSFGPVNGTHPLSAFSGSFTRTVSLVNPLLSGSLIMHFRSFLDNNSNDMFDGGDVSGDTIVYTVILDVTPPVVNCPTTLNLPCGSLTPAPYGNSDAFIAAGGTINENNPNTVTVSSSDAGPVNDGCKDVITRTYVLTDACNNSTSCVQTINIKNPTTPPTSPSDGSGTVNCFINASPPTVPPGTDACGNQLAGSLVSIVTIENIHPNCEGTRTYNYVYTDCNGQTADWKFVYTVDHTTAPVVPANGSATVQCGADAVTPSAPTNVVDFCGNNIPVPTPVISGTYTNCEGTKIYTYTYTDCSGLSTNWVFTYTIDRTTSPSENGGPAATSATVQCDPAAPTLPVVKDACGVTLSAPAPSITGTFAGCEGTKIYTYNYTDCAGLSFQWVFTYTVDRTTDPAEDGAPAIKNATVQCDPSAPALPVVKDFCGNILSAPAPVITGTFAGCEGTKIYTYTYTDCAGLSFVWDFTYNIDHTTAPATPTNGSATVECASSITIPPAPTVTDVCGAPINPSGPIVSGTYLDCEGTVIYTYTYTDCAGLSSDWSFTYTVDHTTAPVTPADGLATVECPQISPPSPPLVSDVCGSSIIPSGPAISYTYSIYQNNLVVNGDFSAGNTGFTSAYTYTPSTVAPSTYYVSADASTNHGAFTGFDHTTGSGLFMVVNGGTTLNEQVWGQSIPVTQNTEYVFSAWVRNVSVPPLAKLQFSINGGTIGPIFNGVLNSWTQYFVTWNSGANTIANLEILNQSTDFGGNDFGLDDISFSESTNTPCEGTQSFTYTYTDCSGLSSDWTFTYTIDHTSAPVTPADGSATVECASAATAPSAPSVTDVCGNSITPSGPVTSGTYSTCEGTIIYIYTYTDCAGLSSDWSFTYTIDHSTAPVTPADGSATVQCSSDATVPPAPSVTDACGNVITPTGPVTSGTYTNCEGTIIYTYTYTDCAGLSSDWSFTYTVDHTTAPVTPADGDGGTLECASAVVPPFLPLVNDVCGSAIIPTGPYVSGTYTNCEGTIIYTYVYTDCSGLSSDWSYTYTIDHTTAPVTPPDGSASVECASAAIAPPAPPVTDVCGNPISASGPVTSGTYVSCEGTIIYTYTYTDCSGLSSDWAFTYTIEHSTAPIVPANGTATVECADDATTPVPPTVTDICGNNVPAVLINTVDNFSSSQTFNYTGANQPFVVPPGVTSVHILALGAEGGRGSRTMPSPSLFTSGGLGGKASGYLAVNPGDVLNVFVGQQGTNGSIVADGTASGGFNGGGNGGFDNNIALVNNGGGGGGSSDVRLNGIALTNRVVVAAGGGGGSGGFFIADGGNGGGLTGNPGGSSAGLGIGGTGGTQVAPGTAFTTTRGATDGTSGTGGNGSTNQNAYGSGGGGGGYYGGGGGTSTQDHGDGDGGGGGGGSSYVTGLTGSTNESGIQSGNGLVIITWDNPACEGTKTYTYAYTDCAGLSSEWTYTYTVDRTTSPATPADGAATVECASAVTTPAAPPVTDACGIPIPPTGPVVSGTYTNCEGTIIYTYTYTDCTGLSSDWSFVYTIDHTTAPATPADGSATVQCATSATPPPAPTVNDVCGTSITPTGPFTSGTYVNCEGTIVYTYVYTDCSGLSSDWTFTYTVDHTTAPTVTVPDGSATVQCASAAIAPPAPPATDVCNNPVSAATPTQSGTYAGCEGTIIYTYLYTDCSGLTTDWTFTYTIDHTTAPVTPADGSATVECSSVALPPPPAPVTDVCGNPVVVTGPVASGTYTTCEGTIIYTYTYTDCSGLSSDWAFTYTIDHSTAPVTPPDGSATVQCATSATAPPAPPVSDVCGTPLTASGPTTSGTYVDCEGTIIYTYVYTDCAGLSSDWSFTYNVDHTTAPVVPANGSATVQCAADAVAPSTPLVNDVCNTPITPTGPVITGTLDDCEGTKIYTYTYTDCSGLSSSWSFTYTVDHTTAPVVPPNAGSTVESVHQATPLLFTPPVTDVCGKSITPVLTSVVDSPVPLVCAPGTRTYTYTYTDCSGLSSNWVYTYTLNVSDNNECTVDACNSFTGNVTHTPVDRNDNNPCTIDFCDPVLGVLHIPLPIDDNNLCTIDACNTVTGVITHNPVNIDDGNACTTDDCNSLIGPTHVPVVVTDNNVCTFDGCDPVTGIFHNPVNVNDNNACTADGCDTVTGVFNTTINTDDGNACTTDGCNSLTGIFHNPISPNDNNACTTDACNTSTGAITNTPVATDDGNACTTDGCHSISGVFHNQINPNDFNACTIDGCNTATGVFNTPINPSDGNACTTDGCNSITGVFNTPISPNDNNACTTDACNTSTGAITNTPVATDDGNACTTDGCHSISGVFHNQINPNDFNACTIDGCNTATGVFNTPINPSDGNACTTDGCNSITGVFNTPISPNDNNACTTDACNTSTGAITNTPVATDDGNACTTDGCHSISGVFHNQINPNDFNACTIDGCNTATGVFNTPINPSDGNACTTDGCNSLTGVFNTPISPNDNNACTTDACNTSTGAITNTPVATDDGNACTTDGCHSISGVFHNQINPNDFNACTIDGCNTATGVFNTPINPSDGNACTTDGCNSITGVFNTPVSPNDNNACTTDACNTSTGAITNTPVATDDGNACTTDGCHSISGVFHNQINPNDFNACTIDGCNTATGVFNTPINPSDGNACTTDGCNSLTGVFNTPISPNDNNACTTDACNTSTGAITNTPVATDDGNACTTDGCHSISGVFHNQINPNDFNACTIDACNTATGVSNTPIATDDGNACTIDGCNSLSGVFHNQINPNDNNVCTTDGCNTLTGVFNTPISPDDGNPCTVDACNSIKGFSHLPVNTSDNNVCTEDACDTATGIISHTPQNNDDGNVCTTDGCNSITGPFHTPVNVDDGNACTVDGCDVIGGPYHNAVAVDDNDPCTIDACNTATGAITHTDATPVVTATPGTIACYGGTTCVSVSATGGTPPYFGGGNYCGYTAGMFSFDIIDSKGCIASSSVITITEPAKLTVGTSTTPSSCIAPDGTATATPVGGTPGFSYLWTPVGQTTNPATGLVPGNYVVTVTDNNGCTASAVAVVNSAGSAPATPGPISGPPGACKKQTGVVWCIDPVPGATSYIWTLPAGASVQGSATGSCITLRFNSGFQGGFLCVKAVNPCGSSNQSCTSVIKIRNKPSTPGMITGPSALCPNTTAVYSINAVPLATFYTWSANNGISIISGQGTTTVTIQTPAGFTGGSVSVKASNCKGNSGSKTKNIVLDSGCRLANPEVKPVTDEVLVTSFDAYPNPTTGKLTIEFNSLRNEMYSLRVVNILGDIMINETITAVEGYNLKEVNLENVAKGIYFISVNTNATRSQTLRIIVH